MLLSENALLEQPLTDVHKDKCSTSFPLKLLKQVFHSKGPWQQLPLPFKSSFHNKKENTSMSEAVVQRCSVKKVFLEIEQFTEKHLCQSLIFNKVAGPRPATLLNKRLWHRCFPVNFMKFLRAPFYIEHLWWLLLGCL